MVQQRDDKKVPHLGTSELSIWVELLHIVLIFGLCHSKKSFKNEHGLWSGITFA
jgi:hypothetical protein